MKGGDALKDNVSTPLDDEDLESGRGGLGEATPLLSQPQRTTTSYSAAAAAVPDEATEVDEQPDLPDIVPVSTNGPGTNAPLAAPKRRRRRKRPTMYDSAMQAMGLALAVIEHAAEVQLSDARGNPAGKVRYPTL